MKTLYIDCGMGAAGDMLTAALLELTPDPAAFIEKLNSIGIPNVEYRLSKTEKCGITGTHVSVSVNGTFEHEHMHGDPGVHSHNHHHEHHGEHRHVEHHEHHHDEHHGEHHHKHNTLHGIEHVISHLRISEKTKKDIIEVYSIIAEAESHVHGCPVNEIHFHEVGTMDAIADVTAVCLLIEELDIQKIIASPIHTGCGQVKCAHGILPVPAPATAYILKGCPIYSGSIKGELCTPTGAALLKHFVSEFGNMPVMSVDSIGYGMGNKDFEIANCVRVFLGETADVHKNEISELQFNVDDMTSEDIAFAAERIFEANAREVFTIPAGMKKGRPGTLFCVICDEKNKDQIIKTIFKYTTTIGMREKSVNRYTLERKFVKHETLFGPITEKVSEGYGVKRSKYEFEDLAKIAKEKGLPLDEVRKLI